MASFPASASAPVVISGIVTPQQRNLGTLQLNDRINTFYDYEVPPGPGTVQSELKVGQNGEIAVMRIDKKATIIPVHMTWRDITSRRWYDFMTQLDAQQGVPFVLGDGTQYDICWAPSSEVQVSEVVIIATHPARRKYKLSLNIRSQHSYRSVV